MALQEAMNALVSGPAEPTSIDGAKVNALHSIAWSLMGILAKQIDNPEAAEGLCDSWQKLGLIQPES